MLNVTGRTQYAALCCVLSFATLHVWEYIYCVLFALYRMCVVYCVCACVVYGCCVMLEIIYIS